MSQSSDDKSSGKKPTEPQAPFEQRGGVYELAFADEEFMWRDELTGTRLLLEFLKSEMIQVEEGILDTVVVFGSARIPEPEAAQQLVKDARENLQKQPDSEEARSALSAAQRVEANSAYYREARALAERITQETLSVGPCKLVVVTGGGPGIMEAANRGASDAGGKSIGLNIYLPFEQQPNPYISPELCFQFHYFAIRKMHFLKRAKALVACPGGYGTLDELFDALTLVQTGKIEPLPILLMGSNYWKRILNLEAMVEEGVISHQDMELVTFVDNAEEAWSVIREHYKF